MRAVELELPKPKIMETTRRKTSTLMITIIMRKDRTTTIPKAMQRARNTFQKIRERKIYTRVLEIRIMTLTQICIANSLMNMATKRVQIAK